MPTIPTAMWRQAFDILDRALDLTPGERAAYIARASDGDDALGAAAAALLAGADSATFLESPAASLAAPLLVHQPAAPDGADGSASRIGPYRILREIGRGGMGAVYLAERADDQYRKQVALKLLPGWSAGSGQAVRRFREERQILAALDHPDIAHLLDGGVMGDGRPWFAMEYVEGLPIDRYCDEHHLSIERRLELFCRVCAAVQYAHRNLVVHRDLKPANILVAADGAVKLLDFGIAKLLGGDAAGAATSLTVTGERLMTPLYASPEQVRGDAISTATDVYSLGVLLHELLTGRYPYQLASREPHAVVRAILEQEPERPSLAALREGGSVVAGLSPAKLARRLRGDLDTIVGTAMQKDPGRRYATAEQLEADVRRHLTGLPVAARPEGRLYRTRKFVGRHRVAVAAAAAMSLLVVGFAVVTAVQAARIRAQAARIAAERDRAEQVSHFLADLFQTSDPYAGAGGGLTARAILDSGAARIDRELAAQPAVRAQMLLEIGRAYRGLGELDRARRFLEVSLAIRRRTPPDARLDLARTLDVVGLVRLEQGELEGAEQAYREALAVRRQLLGGRHRDVARTLNGLAGALRAAGRFRDADSVSREAVAIDEAQVEASRLDLAESLKGLAHAVHERGDHTDAARLYRRALALQQRELPEGHPEVAGTVLDLAAALGETGDGARADSLFRYGLALERRVLGDEHPEVAGDEGRYARLLHRRGSDSEAEALYRHALTIARQRLPAVHPVTAGTLLGLGELLLDRGQADRAEPLLREALAMRRTTLPPGHPGVAEAVRAMGAVIMARRRYAEAERYLLASHDGLRAAYGNGDPRTRAALAQLVQLYEASGQPARAAASRAELERSSPPRPSATPDPERSVDTSVVAIFPFRVGGADPAMADLRDVVQDLLATRFTGEGSPRALDPPTMLRALHGMGAGGAADLPLDVSLRLAERMGARWLLAGEVSGTPRQVTLEAMLVPVRNGTPRARARVEGSADSLPRLADLLSARLLALEAARDSDELVALSRATPPALRAYLAGVHAERQGRVGLISEATRHIERALFLDSTFALAALRLAELAARHGASELDERWKFDAIWDQRDRLGPADRALLAAYVGPRYPRPATLSELIVAGERAAAAAPARAEAWQIAGENLLRFGSKVGYSDWDTRARAALERAHVLDSARAPTLAYLLLLAARAGDSGAVRRYAGLYSARTPLGQHAQFTESYRWLAAISLGDSTGLVAVRDRFADMPRGGLRFIVDVSQTFGVGFGDAERAARIFVDGAASAAHRRAVLMGIVPFQLNRGRPGDAGRLLGMSERGFGQRADVGVLEFRIHAALYWDGDSSDAAAAARSLEGYLAGARLPEGQVRDPRTAACALAHWRLAARDFAGAAAALAGMRRPGANADVSLLESTPFCAAAVEAQLAAALHRPDAATKLEQLDTLLRAGADLQLLMPTVASLIAARLYETRGDIAHALALTRRRAFWWNQLLSTQLREEGRLAASGGDRAAAVRAYRHYLALRSDPEARLRPEVERVRAEVERLERGLPAAAPARVSHAP